MPKVLSNNQGVWFFWNTVYFGLYCNEFEGLKNQSFEINSGRPKQSGPTLADMHCAQITRRQRSGNFGREWGLDESCAAGVLLSTPQNEMALFLSTFQWPTFTKFGHNTLARCRLGSNTKIWNPVIISATVEADNFKFGTQLSFGRSLLKIFKMKY